MSNYLTKEEIRSSVAYRWRKNHVKHTLTVFLVMTSVTLLAMLLSAIADGDMEYIEFSLVCGLIVIAFCSVVLLPHVLFLCYKLIYLTKHYSEFDCIEVALDSFSTSYLYKNSIYYTVTVSDGGYARRVDTDPCFSDGALSEFTVKEWHGKKVIGLYDKDKNKFYVLKKQIKKSKKTHDFVNKCFQIAPKSALNE